MKRTNEAIYDFLDEVCRDMQKTQGTAIPIFMELASRIPASVIRKEARKYKGQSRFVHWLTTCYDDKDFSSEDDKTDQELH